jgi:hypothetical protein
MKILIVLLTTLVSLSALAHHNYRLRYDYDTIITLTGVVTEFEWKNPHTEIFMDVEDESGMVTNWNMPTAAIGVFGRVGVTADTLQPGDKAVISGAPSRNGSTEMRARSMTLEDGSWYWLSPGNPPDGWPGVPADYQPVDRGD